MHSIYVYFKAPRSARAQVRSLCLAEAARRARAHHCTVSCALRADDTATAFDTWLEHYRCSDAANAAALRASLDAPAADAGLHALIEGGATGRHLEAFVDVSDEPPGSA